jgi:hypothetical protein
MPHLGDKSIAFVVSDSIRCQARKVGYPGSDQAESGSGFALALKECRSTAFNHWRNFRLLTGFEGLRISFGSFTGAKKCGVEIGDPNLRFQPRLPGSVVGEASMRRLPKADKITRVTVLR